MEKNINEYKLSDLRFDDAVFETFFKANFRHLCAIYQYKFEFDADITKDVVHTAFIKLWENRQILSPDISAMPYLHKIITNLCLDIIKHEKIKAKHQRHQINIETVQHHNYFNISELKQLELDINKAIAELPEQMQLVFNLSRNEGFKYREIAAHLSISVKTVETQMSRALLKLREKLSHYLPVYLFFFFLKKIDLAVGVSSTLIV